MLRGVLVLCVSVAVVAAAAAEEKVKHPKLQAALAELGAAKAELEASKQDYGGKKAKVVKAVHEAQTSLKLILAVKGDVKGGGREPDYYKAYKDHPHVRAALADLREARRELQDSKADFQGNRKEALKKVDDAIEQLQGLLKTVK